MSQGPRRPRKVSSATASRVVRLTPDMVRVFFTGDDLRALPELIYTDHYIKILFPPEGAGYRWPFDTDEIRQTRPAEEWPVTRTYTIRSYDPETNEMAVDFVVHGDEGLAGPWAAEVAPGASIGFFGPGGGYAPDPEADVHLFVGDEAAIPAIAAALDRLPEEAEAQVVLEVANSDHHQLLRGTSRTQVTWVHRDELGLPYGEALTREVQSRALPAGRIDAFIHGNAEMVKALRRFLFVDHRVERKRVSISGYWRTGQTEDRWQATKGEFNAAMETEEAVSG